jgi:hypothetical protein
MFLVNIQEALRIPPNVALDMSLALIRTMLIEYGYMWHERNKESTEDEHGEFEWVDLPDWDDPAKTNRVKRYKDVGNFV